MLQGQQVEYVPYIRPRGFGSVLKNVPSAFRLIRKYKVTSVISTGSAIALAYLPYSSVRGIPTHYIESATRVEGPSVTGKALCRVPGIKLYNQHEAWADEQWSYLGSVFEGFSSEVLPEPPTRVRRAVVSCGTMEDYSFREFFVKLAEYLKDADEVLWQTGSTDVSDLNIDGKEVVPAREIEQAMLDADVVIAHAGTGTALTSLRMGKRPILVPRDSTYGQHVDDHQFQTAALLDRMGLALSRKVEDLQREDLLEAASYRVVRTDKPRALHL
jgi:UDP-N-acetylglucosamine transferase subunit ALG13